MIKFRRKPTFLTAEKLHFYTTIYNYKNNGFKSPEKEIELLKLQLKYKEQEIDFLKKIVSLGQEESTQ